MDFKLKKYRELLEILKAKGYEVITFKQYCMGEYSQKIVILRHDVDLLPYNSLKTADIEHSLQIKGSYYFRAIKESWDETVVKEIDALGNEIGYHYESLTTCNGDLEKAYQNFYSNLEKFRKVA